LRETQSRDDGEKIDGNVNTSDGKVKKAKIDIFNDDMDEV